MEMGLSRTESTDSFPAGSGTTLPIENPYKRKKPGHPEAPRLLSVQRQTVYRPNVAVMYDTSEK
jgi:hypothetical protein